MRPSAVAFPGWLPCWRSTASLPRSWRGASSLSSPAPIVSPEFTPLVAQGPAIASYFQDLADKDHVVSILGIPIDLRQAYNDAVRNLPALLAGHFSSVVENVFMLLNWIFQTI